MKHMGANKWYKFYGGEYLSDPKIENLTPQERSCWITLLCLASMSTNGKGVIEFLTVEVLLNKSGIQFDPYHPEEWDRSLGVLSKLERMRMITKLENGDIQITNWLKRQETNLTDAERAKSYRDRKRNVTQSSHNKVMNVTQEENRIDKNRIDTGDKERASKMFKIPTIEEVAAYCTERKNGINPQAFIDKNEAIGWKVGKNPMKDWKATIRTWENFRRENQKTTSGPVLHSGNDNVLLQKLKSIKHN
jgi:N-terminal phage replisome organiser (Phage_rep_org_N)